MVKKFFPLLLFAVLLLMLLPTSAHAENSINYDDWNPTVLCVGFGDIVIGPNGASGGDLQQAETRLNPDGYLIYGHSKKYSVTVEASTSIFLSGVNIDIEDNRCAFAIKKGANVILDLSEDNKLRSGKDHAGLEVPKGASLTIEGDGTLTVYGGANGAGIGGGNGGTCGTITINGTAKDDDVKDNIVAHGGTNGAGIGGGNRGNGGTITFNSNISGVYSEKGAGIGGGRGGSGGKITINGGAVGGASTDGAGIGGGSGGPGGSITINSGKIIMSSISGAGIGGGSGGSCGTIIIKSGKTSAYSIKGAAIGGGYKGSGGKIAISGGYISAGSNTGLSMGSGVKGNGGFVTISGGTVHYFYFSHDINVGKRGKVVITGGSVTCLATPSPVNGTNQALSPNQISGLPAEAVISFFTVKKEGIPYAFGAPSIVDSDGYLDLNLPAGSYTLQLTANGTSYHASFVSDGLNKTKVTAEVG